MNDKITNGYDHSLINNNRSVLYKIEIKLGYWIQFSWSIECDELRKIFSYVQAERNIPTPHVTRFSLAR